MGEPIYNELLAQFIKKHGHKPGEQPTKHPIGDAQFRRLFPEPKP